MTDYLQQELEDSAMSLEVAMDGLTTFVSDVSEDRIEPTKDAINDVDDIVKKIIEFMRNK